MGNPIILPNPVAPVSAGDATGALLKLHLGKKLVVDLGIRDQLLERET